MRIFVLALAILLVSNIAHAQFETDYKPIQSRGKLPDDFITLSSEKYEAEKASLKQEKGGAKKAKDQFLLESNFEIDDLLLSGRVVFNDPMSDYVNKVADKVLATDPDTRKKLRFYILKSTYVNATATNQGIIFINMGLLAQLENEAQLAFVISHEIIHYKNKHSINHAVEADKIEKGKGSYKSFSRDEKYLANMSFSKELETEADNLGFDIFKKTLYSATNLIGIYDVLKYSYLPFDDIPFDKSFLENSTYKIPAAFVLTETAPINTKDEGENPKSTHPSIKARREMVLNKIANIDNAGKSDYLVSKEQFELMRTTARFELSRLYLLHHEYEAGIYNSYMLLKKYPDNIFLKKIVMECLENIGACARTGADFDKAHTSYKDIEGKMQAVNYLFERMDSAGAKDIMILALAYAAKLKKEYPKDLDIDVHTKYLVQLVTTEGVDWDYFSGSAPPAGSLANPDKEPVSKPAAIDSAKATAKTDEKQNGETDADGKNKMIVLDEKNENSKYAKIKNQEVKTKQEVKAGKGYYAQYALVDYYNEPWLKDDFAEAAKNKDNTAKTEEIVFGKRSTVSKKVYSMGLDRVLVINPYYARLNANNKKKFKYLQSEDGQIDFSNRLKLNGRKAKLDVEVLDSKKLGSDDIQQMNDITLLEEYVADRLEYDDDLAPFPERQKITELAKKYNTDYFLWTGHYTFYFNMMYDVKTDQIKMGNFREVESRTGPAILNSHIYDTFMQLHAKPKVVKTKN
jgi:hypothetical protein